MLSFGFLGLSFLAGVQLLHWLDHRNSLRGLSFFALSLSLGLVVLGNLSLGLSLVLRNLSGGVVGTLFLAAVFLFWRFRPVKIFQTRWQGLAFRKDQLILAGIVFVLLLLTLQAMLFDSAGLPFGVLKGWGDGAYHLDMVKRLAVAEPFVLDQPIAGGKSLTYPFLVNFLSAVLLRGGLGLPWAWHLPTAVFGITIVLVLFELGKNYFVRKSLALVLVFLVLFGAGLGFLWFFQQVKQDAVQQGWLSSFFANLAEPKFEYTHLDNRTGGKPEAKNFPANIVWIVPAISFFSHQRSFFLGAVLGISVLFGLLVDKANWRWLLLLGFLPLAHSHSFLALVIFVLVYSFDEMIDSLVSFFKRREISQFLRFGFMSFLLALPQLAYLLSGVFSGGTNNGFFLPWFGWMSCSHRLSWFFCDPNVLGTDQSVSWFWLKNFGFVFVVWLSALLLLGLKKLDHQAKELIWPSLILFGLPNLFLFQPWEFDNNKILFWWWVIAILICLSLFDKEEKSREFSHLDSQSSDKLKTQIPKLKKLLLTGSCLLFVALSSFSGLIDVWSRIKTGLSLEENQRYFGYYSKEDLVIAEWIKNQTKPNEIFLTHSQANQFIPMTTGRPIYLGFIGWLWTQGQKELISQRQATIKEFLLTEKVDKLCQEGVKYWLKEPRFFVDYPNSANNDFAEVGEKVFEFNGKEIIKLKCD